MRIIELWLARHKIVVSGARGFGSLLVALPNRGVIATHISKLRGATKANKNCNRGRSNFRYWFCSKADFSTDGWVVFVIQTMAIEALDSIYRADKLVYRNCSDGG